MVQSKVLTFGIIVAFLVVFITGCSASPTTSTKEMKNKSKYDALAMCLKEKGTVFYQIDSCPYCREQKELFGTSVQYLGQVDCDQDRQVCRDAGVEKYPTWKIDGKLSVGKKLPEQLAEMAGCSI